jgi:nucleoside-diphosphate-sugar epimerase
MTPAFWSGKSVFLTGHTGFKGSWLSLLLQSFGARVTGYALPAPTTPSLFKDADIVAGMESLIGESGRKEAEAKLSDILGKKVKLQLVIGDVPEPESISEEEPEAPEPAKAAEPPPPPANPADDFKNDPLIRKALEIFAAEIQTT